MSASISPPFYANIPPGYAPADPTTAGTSTGTSTTGAGTSTTTPAAADTVDITPPLPGGTFTAEAGDSFSLSDLYSAGPDAFDTVASYRVALRDDTSSGAKLLLNGVDVTSQVDFTPTQFNQLQFVAGSSGSQDLLVAARSGTPDGKGGLTGIVDSPAVQITASVTGVRSVNAAAALRTLAAPTDADSNFLAVAQQSAVYSGYGATRLALTTAGNFTAEAGDSFSLSDLYSAGPDAFDTVASYRVALRDDTSSGAKLLLNGVDVTSQVDFTPTQFNQLQFVAGSSGSQDLLVAARSGTPDGKGGLTGIVDSPAVQITASVTGVRSVNAAAALRTLAAPTDADSNFLAVAQQSAVYSGYGATRPALTTAGNFTAEAGDSFSLSDLYSAGPDAFDTVASYRVALRDDTSSGAKLLLNGVDVTSQVDFTPTQFNQLQFVAGSSGSQDLLVAARSGTPDGKGGLTGIVDSPAVQITASVTGVRSVNAAAALRTLAAPTDADSNFLAVAQQSAVYSGYGATRPALTTAGNFTAEAGDSFSLSDLYSAGPDAFDTVASYRVALRDDTSSGAKLLLNGVDVTSQVDFTPTQFNQLQFVAGSSGSQDLLVAARSGTPDGKGGLTGIVDSPAVQITASVTGVRSVNAAAALRTLAAPTDADSNFLAVAQQSAVYSGYGATRPALTTAGNFTAEAGDSFSLSDLYSAGPDAFDTVASYRVALRDDTSSGAKLLLNGVDVTSQVDFTPTQFNQLQFVAGSSGSQDLLVAARSGTPDGKGGLTGIVDSPAVQITASVTGVRSVNAAAALRTLAAPTDADSNFLAVAQQSAVYSGYGATRPALTTVIPDAPPAAPQALAAAVGAYQASAADPASTAADVLGLYPDAIGSSVTAGATTDATLRALLLLLGDAAVGGFALGGAATLTQQQVALAYQQNS